MLSVRAASIALPAFTASLAIPPAGSYLHRLSDNVDGVAGFLDSRNAVKSPCPDDGQNLEAGFRASALSARHQPSESTPTVAKTTPIEFINQVRAETAKVIWPTMRETVMTGLMVVIMTGILGIFFFGVDSIFAALVQLLLKLAK